ncbi:methionine--tRNA ligase [Candidatus Parcubacteria bacterium]|nr:methionine--tRNA ligase [Candidatus Parcubacteria bacterium]
MSKKPFYITTTLPYLNASPHIGFALEIIRADAIARYKDLMGHEVFFNTGTDEHGQKIYQAALDQGKDPQAYVDEIAKEFQGLKEKLGLYNDIHFVRTTDVHHKSSAQHFWKICDEAGYIYKKKYKGLYCVGCELFKTEKELINEECPVHPGKKPDEIEEENYFFKFSSFTDDLIALYNAREDFVKPDFRYNEIKNFVKGGLEDFSISRVKDRMPWGVPVPGDEDQVMYVWFDALTNYISTLGWPEDSKTFEKFWVNGTTLQIAGKDNLRQQSAMWQAMLMAANLPPTDNIIINGFIVSDGQKMSKSLGNVINPYDLVDEFGVDALRYFILRHVGLSEDSDVTVEKFKDAYNANLANGIGNLVSRILKMVTSYSVIFEFPDREDSLEEIQKEESFQEYREALESYDFNKAMDFIWKEVGDMDEFIAKEQPFKKIKEDEDTAKEDLAKLLLNLWYVSILLEPLLPNTAEKIQEHLAELKMPEEPLFVRKD